MSSCRASCSCGQLQVQYDGTIARTSICHCHACQKRTGSAFGVQTRLAKEKTRVIGAAKKYDRPTDEGDFVHFFFCPECGATVYWEIDDLPESIIAPIGAFAGQDLPAPGYSVYEDHMLSWVVLPGSITEHMK